MAVELVFSLVPICAVPQLSSRGPPFFAAMCPRGMPWKHCTTVCHLGV